MIEHTIQLSVIGTQQVTFREQSDVSSNVANESPLFISIPEKPAAAVKQAITQRVDHFRRVNTHA